MMNNPKKRRATASQPRGTKSAGLIALLRRERGASLAEITSNTGWLSHTARARLTELRKQGLAVQKMKSADGTRYFIKPEAAA